MHLSQCEAWITCDDKPLPEYGTDLEGSSGKQIGCFVPSEAGKRFVVHLRNSFVDEGRAAADDDVDGRLRLALTLDGTTAGAHSIRYGREGKWSGLQTGPAVRQPFQFSNIVTTDDDDEALHRCEENASDLGVIRVTVERILRKRRAVSVERDENRRDDEFTKFDPVHVVHERSKKAGVHCVTLGKAERLETKQKLSKTARRRLIVIKKELLATFEFRYRPLALLQAQGVAPPPEPRVEPEPSQPDRSEEDVIEIDRPATNGETESRPAKRPRRDPEDVGVKPDAPADLSDYETELSALKLAQIMSRIDRMEKEMKRRKVESHLQQAKQDGARKSPLLPSSSGDVIDLTLSD